MKSTLAFVALLGFAGAVPAQDAASDAFMQALLDRCGEAYAGQVVANRPVTGPDPFANRYLVMHVADCTPKRVRMNFHVSDGSQREWIVERTARGLRLRHEHFADTRAPFALSGYGGETVAAGTPQRQEFPVDPHSIALFEREGLEVARGNVWALELQGDRRFLYELARDDGRLLQIAFDLANPVAPPDTPLAVAARRDGDDWDN